MGWLSAIGSMFSWLGSEGIGASLVRVVMGMAVMRYLNKSTNNSNNSVGGLSQTPQGIRQQIQPATENKIPVVYGDAFLGGTIIDVRLTNNNKSLYAVIAICEQTGDIFSTSPSDPLLRSQSNIIIDDIFINNNKITFDTSGTTVASTTDETGVVDTNPAGILGIYLYKGSSNSPMLPCQTGTDIPIYGNLPPAAYEIMPGWTTSHTCQNTIFAVIKLNYDPSKGLTTIPNLKFHVRNNLRRPGDVLHDYSTNVIYGAGINESLIDNDAIIALNDYSSERVTYAPYPEQERYQINGVIRTSENVLSNMQAIAASAGSSITYDISLGKWSVIINKLTSSTLTFNDSNIIGQIAVSGTSLESFYNSVEVQFPYAYLKDQHNFIRIDLPENLRNLNEEDNMLQVTYELVNNVVQASILGNLELRQSREDISVTFNTDYSKFNSQVGDVFSLTNSAYGWTNKLFRIMRIKKNESDTGQLTLEITGLAYNTDVYTVEPISDFIPLIGPGHSLPNLGAISKPNAPTVTFESLVSQPNIQIQATVPSGVVTEMEFWYANNNDPTKYSLLGSMRSENGGAYNSGSITIYKTLLLNSGDYLFRVRAVNDSGSSEFSNATGPLSYTYTQSPDVLPYKAPIVDNAGNSITQNGTKLSMGMLAMFLASKLNWGDILNWTIGEIADIFGLEEETVQEIKDALALDKYEEKDEEWDYIAKTSQQYVVGGVCLEKITSMTFRRPSGKYITIHME